MGEDLKTRFKPGESGNKNRIGGLQIVSRKPDVGQVFEADAKKWRAIHRAGLGGGWNKNGFLQKMAAGHVMDEEIARCYLVVACLNALERYDDIVQRLQIGIKAGGCLSKDEQGTLKQLNEACKIYNEMAKAIIGLAGLKNKTNEDSPPKEYPPGEHPFFDYMTVRAIVNGVERNVTIKTVDYKSTLPLKPSPSIPPDEQL